MLKLIGIFNVVAVSFFLPYAKNRHSEYHS